MKITSLIKFALISIVLAGCTSCTKKSDLPVGGSVPANENQHVSICGDPDFVIKNCVYQYNPPSGDWYTQGFDMTGLTAFNMTPQCIQDECQAYNPYPPGSQNCLVYDQKAKVRSPSSYSAFSPSANDVRPIPAWTTVWTLWCGTNALHQVGDHLHVRSVSAPL
jgi:hypothetical protein